MPRNDSAPGHNQLRAGRRSEPGRVYLLTIVTSQRARLFVEWPQASVMSRELASPALWPGATLLCWVLMPDHWHGLLRLDDSVPLAKVMNTAKGRSARLFNLAFGLRGPVWAPAFHDRAMRRDDDLRAVARYVIANPLRAGLAASIANYPFWNATWLSDDSPL